MFFVRISFDASVFKKYLLKRNINFFFSMATFCFNEWIYMTRVLDTNYSWSDSWNRQQPPSLADISINRNLRKPSDRSPRTPRPRQDETFNRQNGFSDKASPDNQSGRRSIKFREAVGSKSLDFNDLAKVKSSIPSPKKLTMPTQIPRAARAVSATGRSHNP